MQRNPVSPLHSKQKMQVTLIWTLYREDTEWIFLWASRKVSFFFEDMDDDRSQSRYNDIVLVKYDSNEQECLLLRHIRAFIHCMLVFTLIIGREIHWLWTTSEAMQSMCNCEKRVKQLNSWLECISQLFHRDWQCCFWYSSDLHISVVDGRGWGISQPKGTEEVSVSKTSWTCVQQE